MSEFLDCLRRWILLVNVTVAVVVVHVQVIRSADCVPPKDSLQLLTWFPSNTESLIAVNRAIALPDEFFEDRDDYAYGKLEEVMFERAIWPLILWDQAQCLEALRGARLRSSLVGGRNFRCAAAGLGPMDYDGCHVLEFCHERNSPIKRLFAQLKRFATKVTSIAGHEVYIVEKQTDSDSWTFYFTYIGQRHLVMATEKTFFTEVLKRANGARGPRALPEELSEWKHVNRQASFWGIRHYDPAFAASDPSSPLNERELVAFVEDPNAIGVTFQYDLRVANPRLQVNFLSRNKELDALWRERLPGFGFEKVEVRRISAENIQLSFDVSERQTAFLDFILLSLFGWGAMI